MIGSMTAFGFLVFLSSRLSDPPARTSGSSVSKEKADYAVFCNNDRSGV